MIHSLPFPAITVADDGCIHSVNRLAEDFFGPLLAKDTCSCLQDTLGKEYRSAFPFFLAETTEEKPTVYRAILDKKYGQQCPVLLHISRLASTSLLVLLQKDTTLHCYTSCEKVRILEAQYDNNPAGILLVNDKMEMISFNQEFIRIWNIPTEVLQTRNDSQCLHTVLSQVKDPDTFIEKVRFLYDNPDKKSTDEITLRDGRVFTRHSYPVHHGRHYLGRVWYFIDITSFKEAEEKIIQQQQFQEAILEHIRDGIIACDSTGDITLLNPAGRRMHGYTENDILRNQWLKRFRVFHADGFTPMALEEMPLQKVLRGTKLANEEMTIITDGGERRELRANGEAMLNSQGEKIGAVVSLHDITDLNSAREQLQYLAHHDALTDLPNRLLFHDLLQQCIRRALRNSEKIGILFLDLDNFKQVNDKFGHDAGDQLLVNLSLVIKGCLRDSDILCRWGGDEFIVALPQILQQLDVEHVADKICHAIENALQNEYHSCHVSTSIGIAMFPKHGDIPDHLIRNADMAMYTAKQTGKNRYVIAEQGSQRSTPASFGK